MTPAAAIVCGKAVPPGEQPWLVQVVRLKGDDRVYYGADEPICSGSLIERQIVVTAAHCIKEIGPGRMGILAWTASGASKPFRVANYRSLADGQASDVALLLLGAPTDVTAFVRLPQDQADVADISTAQIAGYGTIWPTAAAVGKSTANKMCSAVEDIALPKATRSPRQGTVDILEPSHCSSDPLKDADVDAKTIICAHGPRSQPSGICGGDSGGPLITFDMGQWPTIIGVAYMVRNIESENPESCINNPGLFSAVAPLVRQIHASIKELSPSNKPVSEPNESAKLSDHEV